MARITSLVNALYSQTVDIEPFTGQDASGEPSYGTAVTYKARVVDKRRLLRVVQGREVISKTTVYLNQAPVLDSRDRVTLPPEYVARSTDDRTPPILDIHRYPDTQGPVYTQVML